MNNVFFSEDGTFVGVEQDDAASCVAKFFNKKISNVVDEYRERTDSQLSGGDSYPTEESLQPAELLDALQKVRIDDPQEEKQKKRKVSDTDGSNNLSEIREAVNELVEAHGPSGFLEAESTKL